MAGGDNEKTCFVIAPIGEEGTEARNRSDVVLRRVIAPAVGQCGYTALRADNISEPGMITSQIIEHLIDDPLVVADLTGDNPNVFYELAVRHVAKKPVVHIIGVDQRIPFDVAGMRAISLNYLDLDSAAECSAEIVRQIQAVEGGTSQTVNPISQAIDLLALSGSENPMETSTAEMISRLERLQFTVDDLRTRPVRPGQLRADIVQELINTFDSLDACLTLKPGQKPTKAQLKNAQHLLRKAKAAIRSKLPTWGEVVGEIRSGWAPNELVPPDWIWAERDEQ